jgi:hypothetical protein
VDDLKRNYRSGQMPHDYEVGYKKPPEDSRFKKGESGNPNGRPKGIKNLKTDLVEELQEKIPVREGDRSVEISKQRLIVKTLVTKTLRGDARITNTLVNLILRVLDLDGTVAETDQPLSADEQEAFTVLEERLLRKAKTTTSTRDDPDSKRGES